VDGEEIAKCPSCSLMIRVIYDLDTFRQKADESCLIAEIVVA